MIDDQMGTHVWLTTWNPLMHCVHARARKSKTEHSGLMSWQLPVKVSAYPT